jgi:AcrR family transcriptional regulator
MTDARATPAEHGDAPAVRTAKGRRTEQRLLDAARARFGQGPYTSVSITQIARDCGLTAAAAYAYFPDKQAMFERALDAEIEAWLAASAGAAHGDQPMAAWFGELRRALDSFPLVARVLSSGTGDDVRRVFDSEPMRTLRDVIEAGLVVRQQTGVTTDEFSAAALADGTQTLIFALLTLSIRTGTLGRPERVAGVISVFQAALGRPDRAT